MFYSPGGVLPCSVVVCSANNLCEGSVRVDANIGRYEEVVSFGGLEFSLVSYTFLIATFLPSHVHNKSRIGTLKLSHLHFSLALLLLVITLVTTISKAHQ